MPYDTFWHLSMKELNAHFEGYRRKRKRMDEDMYYMGLYNKIAFEVVMANFGAGLGGKKPKAQYLKEPLLSKALDEGGMTEDERYEAAVRKDMAMWEMWSAEARRKGLPETKIAKAKQGR